jgi:hypothetical protein
MIFDFLKRNEKPFPEKGTFRGVQYRIDGDEVVFRCSSGQEISFAPIPERTPEDFDRQRAYLAPELIPWRRRDLSSDRDSTDEGGERQSISQPDDVGENSRAYGIGRLEYIALHHAANEIIRRYWKSRRSRR